MTPDEKSQEIKRLKEYSERLNKKLQVATIALKNVRDWDEDSEDIWDDQGHLAIEALNKINEL